MVLKICNECDIEVHYIDGYRTCMGCGIIDMGDCEYVTEYISSTSRLNYKPQIYYKRINYFIKLLDRLIVSTGMNNKTITNISSQLRDTNIRNISDIKTWLKYNKYNKYVKYIYIIYNNAYNEKLISLTTRQYDKVLDDFKKYDREFNKTGCRNQLNYNFIIYKLFEHNQIDNTNILLTCTAHRLNLRYNNLLS